MTKGVSVRVGLMDSRSASERTQEISGAGKGAPRARLQGCVDRRETIHNPILLQMEKEKHTKKTLNKSCLRDRRIHNIQLKNVYV